MIDVLSLIHPFPQELQGSMIIVQERFTPRSMHFGVHATHRLLEQLIEEIPTVSYSSTKLLRR